MHPSRTPKRPGRLRRLIEEGRRRKVHRTLTIYGAVVWAAIASAPDLFQYLGVPSWAFPVLLVTLALGLPIVVVLSWTFAFSLQEERSIDDDGPIEALTPEDVERVSFLARHRLVGWIVPLAGVAAVAIGIRWLVHGSPASSELTVALWTRGTDVDGPRRTIQQTLEWLAGATILGSGPALAEPADGLEEARHEGARYLVVVQTSRTDDVPALSVTLYRTDPEQRILVSSGGGPAEALEVATGRISLQLARFLAEREGRKLAVEEPVTIMTSSPIALAHLLEGQRRFAAADFDAAADALERAIDTDSAFVPAFYRLAVVEQWRWDYAAGLRAVDEGLALADIPPRWARILQAERSYLLRDVRGALSGYEEVTLHYPELTEGWLGLGEALFHYGGFAGSGPVDARLALERVAEEGPFAPVEHHLAELAMWRGDSLAARHAITLMSPTHPARPAMEMAFDIRFGAPDVRARAWASLRTHDLRDLSLLVAHFGFDPSTHAFADSTAAVLLDPKRPPEDRLRGAQYRLMLASDSAQWTQRKEAWRSVAGTDDFDPWMVHAYQAGLPAPEAPSMLRWAGAQLSSGRIPDFSLPLSDDLRRAFNALVHQAVIAGDSAAVLGLLSSIDAAQPADPSDPAPEILSAALRSRLALLASDTADAIAELSHSTARTTEPFIAFYPLSTMAPERLLLIRLAEATGQHALVERWCSSFFQSNSFGDLIYQSWVDELRTWARSHSPPFTQGGIP